MIGIAKRAAVVIVALACLHYAFPSSGSGTTLLRQSTAQEPRVGDERSLGDASYQDNYPPELFTFEEKSNGAIVLYFVGMLYMFISLAIVCDECFVPALEVISDKLQLSPDVAGATFMAAGGSAPEFFTNLIGANLVKSDVGIGTIVGSAVFNVLFVIGMCAFASPWPLKLTWYPLARDSLFYTLDLLVLSAFFGDAEIQWYESIVLFILYIFYAVFMSKSEAFEAWIKERLGEDMTAPEDGEGDGRWATKREDEQPGDNCAVNPAPDVVLQDTSERTDSKEQRPSLEKAKTVGSAGEVPKSAVNPNDNFAVITPCADGQGATTTPQTPGRSSLTPGSIPSKDSSGSTKEATMGKKLSTASATGATGCHSHDVTNSRHSTGSRRSAGENKMFDQRRQIRRSITVACHAPNELGNAHHNTSSRVALRSELTHAMLKQGHGGGSKRNVHAAGHAGKRHSVDVAGSERGDSKDCPSSGVIPTPPGEEDRQKSKDSARPDSGAPAWTGGTISPEAPQDPPGCSSMPETQTLDPPPPDCPCPHTVHASAPADSSDHNGAKDSNEDEEEEEEESEPLEITLPDKDAGIVAWAQFIATLPIIFVLVWTVPDVRREGREKLYMLSFGMSILWIATFTYFMIWYTTAIAYTMGVPVHIMGLTVLAAGTSVPDLLTSVIVARQGKGDMAVSSSIGSNIFDVTIGLPIPWLIFSAVNQEPVRVANKGLGFSIMVLLLMVFCTVMTIKVSHWVMSKNLGIAMCLLYVLFMLQSVLVEIFMPEGIQFR